MDENAIALNEFYLRVELSDAQSTLHWSDPKVWVARNKARAKCPVCNSKRNLGVISDEGNDYFYSICHRCELAWLIA